MFWMRRKTSVYAKIALVSHTQSVTHSTHPKWSYRLLPALAWSSAVIQTPLHTATAQMNYLNPGPSNLCHKTEKSTFPNTQGGFQIKFPCKIVSSKFRRQMIAFA